MAADTYGPKNEPQYAGLGTPADAADLSDIAAYAAKVGNRKVDLSSVRTGLTGADVWEGLDFYETDTGQSFRVIGGSWVPTDKGFKAWQSIATTAQVTTSDGYLLSQAVTVIAGHDYKVSANLLGGQVTSNGTPSLFMVEGPSQNSLARITAGIAQTVGVSQLPFCNFAMYTAASSGSLTFGIYGSTSAGAWRATGGGDFIVEDLGVIH